MAERNPLSAAACIHHVPILRVLPEKSHRHLQANMRHLRLGPGEPLIHRGDCVDALYVVAEGRLAVSRTSAKGREQVVRELGPGQFYGELALFTTVPSDSDVIAVSDAEVCILDRQALQAELSQAPQATWALVRSLAERLAAAEQSVADLALLDVGGRLAATLLRFASPDGPALPGATYSLPYSWADLASRLGTTPESLSRRLRTLQDDGLIEVDGREVKLLDPDGLAAVIDTP